MDGGGSDSLVCLVGRELCLFTTLDASKAPKKQRKDFAALAVRRAAPFADPEFDAAWSADGKAAVWYWSRSRVAALAMEETTRRRRFVAEALYCGAPGEDASELLTLAEGCEGRVWKSGRLQASRWWPQVPTIEQWGEFLRGAGKPAPESGDLPTAEAALLSDIPWSRQSASTDSLQLAGFDQYLPKVALALGAALLLAIGGELGAAARAQIDIWQAGSAANGLDAELKRILDAREATDNASSEIYRLLALQEAHPTTSIMAELTRLMAGNEWQLKKWDQPRPDALEVSLIAADANPEKLVADFEASPLFQGVTTELGREGEITIKATIEAPSYAGAASTP